MADQYCLFLIPLRLIDEKLPELFYVLTDFVEIRDRLLSGDVSISDDESVLISIPAYKCCQCIDSFKYIKPLANLLSIPYFKLIENPTFSFYSAC